MSGLGRYSYMAADPFCTLRIDKPHRGALDTLATLMAQYYSRAVDGLPPMQGGMLGWFGYELGGCYEKIPAAEFNEFRLPLAAIGLYDVVLAWDHETNEAFLISQGWPIADPLKRQRRAYRRLQYFLNLVEAREPLSKDAVPKFVCELPKSQLAPQYPTRWSEHWTSNFSSAGFRDAVARAVEYVHAGDIFQVNIAQRLLRKAKTDARSLYLHLRSENPVPFGGFADFGRIQVVSSSPERFLKLNDRNIETRPIKGTRPRMSDPAADQAMSELLRQSEKDRAENVMIVDLMRNDLSRVSEIDSVQVTSLCQLEAYRYVWHLVSVIRSRLASGLRLAIC